MAFESTVVARVSARALLRWRPPDVSRRRELKAIAFNLGPALVGFAGLALLAPQSDWSQPVLLAALAACSAIAFAAEARLKAGNRVFFGANLVIALVTLAVAGPIPALLIWLVPDLITRFCSVPSTGSARASSPTSAASRWPCWSAPCCSRSPAPPPAPRWPPRSTRSASRCGWSTSASRGSPSRPSTSAIDRPSLIRDEFVDLGPAVLGMLVVGVVAAVLVESIGVIALAPLALVILVPQAALERIAGGASAAYLEPLGGDPPLLGGDRRRARGPAGRAPPARLRRRPRRAVHRPARDAGARMAPHDDASEAVLLALHARERWAGNGRPPACRPRRSRAAAASWRSPTPGPASPPAARPSSRSPRRSWRSPPSRAAPSTRRSSRRQRAWSATRRASPARPPSSPRSTGFRYRGPCGAWRCRWSSRVSSTSAPPGQAAPFQAVRPRAYIALGCRR